MLPLLNIFWYLLLFVCFFLWYTAQPVCGVLCLTDWTRCVQMNGWRLQNNKTYLCQTWPTLFSYYVGHVTCRCLQHPLLNNNLVCLYPQMLNTVGIVEPFIQYLYVLPAEEYWHFESSFCSLSAHLPVFHS